jgi:hypothetical protein
LNELAVRLGFAQSFHKRTHSGTVAAFKRAVTGA